jgi:TolA-binding protein
MSDLHLAKAAEDATRKNVMAVVEHSNETRAMLRQLETQVEFLARQVATMQGTLGNTQHQLAILQAKVHGTGPTDGNHS